MMIVYVLIFIKDFFTNCVRINFILTSL